MRISRGHEATDVSFHSVFYRKLSVFTGTFFPITRALGMLWQETQLTSDPIVLLLITRINQTFFRILTRSSAEHQRGDHVGPNFISPNGSIMDHEAAVVIHASRNIGGEPLHQPTRGMDFNRELKAANFNFIQIFGHAKPEAGHVRNSPHTENCSACGGFFFRWPLRHKAPLTPSPSNDSTRYPPPRSGFFTIPLFSTILSYLDILFFG